MTALELSKKYKTLLNNYYINTPKRLAMFFAQIDHESGGFKWLKELGNDSYFNKYDGRKDLGNTQKGDGLRFKGRGYIQVTGRYNYTLISKDTKIDYLNNPHWLEREADAMISALWYWQKKNLNKFADASDLKGATKVINGGYTHLKDREEKYNKYLKVFN
jgi:putative chitinase